MTGEPTSGGRPNKVPTAPMGCGGCGAMLVGVQRQFLQGNRWAGERERATEGLRRWVPRYHHLESRGM